jgi:hypothetical protein
MHAKKKRIIKQVVVVRRNRQLPGPLGIGLYAAADLVKGQTVVGIAGPLVVLTSETDAYRNAKKRGAPMDAMFFLNQKRCIHDRAIGNLAYYRSRKLPSGSEWYALNHAALSEGANLEAYYDRKAGTVYFRCLRDISAGEQLAFDYGRPDPSWSSVLAPSVRITKHRGC